MTALLILPLLLPALTAALTLLLLQSPRAQHVLGVAGAVGLLGAGIALFWAVWRHGILAATLGGWPAPFGITLVADLFSALMVLLTGITALAVSVYSMAAVGPARKAFGYYTLLHVLLMGVCGAFLTGDIFNLFVWFEVMLMSSFVLVVLGGQVLQLEGAIKYVVMNLLSSLLFLCAVGVLYGEAGTLNMADLAQKLGAMDRPQLVTPVALLFFTAFAIKAALFPLFFWLPASYHTPPIAVTALFAALLTKVGVYALVRVFQLVFVYDADFFRQLFAVFAALTMLAGVLGALAQRDLRKMLIFLIISEVGFLLLGPALRSEEAFAGMFYLMIHVVLAEAGLFLCCGVIFHYVRSYQLARGGGLYEQRPWLAGVFLLLALSLGGLPPFSGFYAKLAIVRAALALEAYVLVAVALVVSLLTLYLMARVWQEVFWKQAPEVEHNEQAPGPVDLRMAVPLCLLAAPMLLLGLFPEPFYQVAFEAARQLMDPTGYIEAVLGGGGLP